MWNHDRPSPGNRLRTGIDYPTLKIPEINNLLKARNFGPASRQGMTMKKYLLPLLFVFLFCPASTWGKPPAFTPKRTIALVFSSNVHGEVEPCG